MGQPEPARHYAGRLACMGFTKSVMTVKGCRFNDAFTTGTSATPVSHHQAPLTQVQVPLVQGSHLLAVSTSWIPLALRTYRRDNADLQAAVSRCFPPPSQLRKRPDYRNVVMGMDKAATAATPTAAGLAGRGGRQRSQRWT